MSGCRGVFSHPQNTKFWGWWPSKGDNSKFQIFKIYRFCQTDDLKRGNWPYRVQIWPYFLARPTPSLSFWLILSITWTSGSNCPSNTPLSGCTKCCTSEVSLYSKEAFNTSYLGFKRQWANSLLAYKSRLKSSTKMNHSPTLMMHLLMLLINHSTSSAISIEGESGENHIIMFYYYKNIELNLYFNRAC